MNPLDIASYGPVIPVIVIDRVEDALPLATITSSSTRRRRMSLALCAAYCPQPMQLAWRRPVPPWNWLCQATGGVPLPRSERGGRREAAQGVHLNDYGSWCRKPDRSGFPEAWRAARGRR